MMNHSIQKKIFKELDHTADLRVEIYGSDQEDLFLNAIQTLYTLLGMETGSVTTRSRPRETVKIHGVDPEDVMVRLLGELLYSAVADKKQLAPETVFFETERQEGDIAVRVEGKWLPCREADRNRAIEIKAVTYHESQIWQTPAGYVARVVMDI